MAGVMPPPPPAPPPMDTDSLPSVARATVQPPLTGPTTSSSGTNTSLKKTSLNSECPVTMRSGRTSTPSACMSMTMVVMPSCLGTSGSVRIVARPKPARWAPLVQTFWPLTSQPPSTRVPRVLIPAASLPASGSLKSWHQMTSWRSAGSTQRATWSSVACWTSVRMTQPVIPYWGRVTPGRTELLLNHQLLHGAGIAAPGLGPVRHHVSGLDHGGPPLGRVQSLDPLGEAADLVAHRLGLGRQVDGARPLRSALRTALATSIAAASVSTNASSAVARRR